MSEKKIKIILAAGINGEIGESGNLPWSIPEDMKYFRIATSKTDDPMKQNAIIMGRLTHKSIGRKLPNRVNIVVSKVLKQTENPDIFVFNSPSEALAHALQNEKIENIFVIGGKQIYEYFLPLATHIHLTQIEKGFPNADCFLKFGLENFKCTERNEKIAQIENLDVAYSISVYRRLYPENTNINENNDEKYFSLVSRVLSEGIKKNNRTDTDTLSIFGSQIVYDFKYGFPLFTTKKIYFKAIVAELLWFLKGDTNIKYLNENGVKIWNEWANENGDLGPIYGKQWVKWGGYINQIENVINLLKRDPDSRRIVVSAWNAGELGLMALQPCHYSFQFYTRPIQEHEKNWNQWRGYWGINASNPERFVDIIFNMRSNDLFLGHPFNVASYALLLQMVAQCTNMLPGKIIFSGGDVHLYENHLEQTKQLLERDCRKYLPPWVELNSGIMDIFKFSFDDIMLKEYESFPTIAAKIAV